MSVTIAELDRMPAPQAAELLGSCCGSAKWVEAMITRRPFDERTALLTAADNFWRSLAPEDWLEAFAHHPRIGERSGALAQSGRGQEWSAGEQAGMNAATDAVRAELAATNRLYEERFGYVCIVSASGKSAGEMLELVGARLDNDPGAELAVAAKEQQKIMRIRLEKLLR